MPKILIVANVAKEHILKFHIPTIKMLKDEGWSVHVACSGEEKIPQCDKKWKMTYGRSPYSLQTLLSIFQLRKIISSENFDIIHCHTPTGGLTARLAAWKAKSNNAKIIYTAHGYHFYKGAPIINWLLYFTIEWILSMITDYIITINNEDYSNTIRFNFKAKKVVKINGVGVKLERFKQEIDYCKRIDLRRNLGITENSLVLIYVAELTKNKNQGYLIRMVNELKKNVDNVVLILVGPDHNKGKYKNLAEKLGLSEIVIFLGWRNDIEDLLSISDISVASSLREGLGLNIIEAMASGLPVVAVKNRGHIEIIEDGYSGFIIEQGDINGMVEKIKLLVKDKEFAEKIIRGGKIEIERFDERKILDQLKNLYYEILNSNSERGNL